MALGVSVGNEREERARVVGRGCERRRAALRVKEAIGEQMWEGLYNGLETPLGRRVSGGKPGKRGRGGGYHLERSRQDGDSKTTV